MSPQAARRWHTLTFVVVSAALVLQFVLVVKGNAILDETNPPGLGLRVARFFAYFTVQCNLLVAVVSGMLARDPAADGRLFRVLRLDAIVGIAVTGLVHWFLLRPLLSLEGADYVADKLLHVVVPVLAVIGWAAFGPRPRIRAFVVSWALAWPVGWLVVTLVVGAISRWYPYPFLDVGEHGYLRVLLTSLGVTALFLLLFAAVRQLDARLQPAPRRPASVERHLVGE